MFLILTFVLSANAFILTDPKWRLKNPENTKVYISDEGCGSSGVSDGELGDMIKKAIEKYWNTVPESKLKLKFAGTSSVSISESQPPSGQIIIGCVGGISADGITNNTNSKGSSRIRLNGATVAGNSSDAIIGLIVHEMGHSVGLSHSKDKASVMTYENTDWTPMPKYLSQDDKDGVVYLYPNEKQLGGLVPTCESFAGEEDAQSSPGFFITMLFGFAVFSMWRWKKIK